MTEPTPYQLRLIKMLRHVSHADAHPDPNDASRMVVHWTTSLTMRKEVLLRLLGTGYPVDLKAPSCDPDSHIHLGADPAAAVQRSPAGQFFVVWQDTTECTYAYQQATRQQSLRANRPLLGCLVDDCMDTQRPTPPYVSTAKVTLNTEEVNPDLDITPQGSPSTHTGGHRVAWLYDNDGKCITSLPMPALGRLATQLNEPGMSSAQITQRICTAAKRAVPRYCTKQRAQPAQPYALTRHLAQALQSAFHLQVDWFSHPLAQHGLHCSVPLRHNTQSTWFSHRWTGYGLVNVPHTQEAVARSLKWAILSTDTTQPTLLALVLPTPSATDGCQKFLRNARVLQQTSLRRATNVWLP